MTCASDPTFAVRLMEHLVVPTFVLDTNGEVLIWNRACQRLSGVSASEVIGTREHWRAFYEAPRPCLADLLLSGEMAEANALYEELQAYGTKQTGLSAENWCTMPRLGSRRYLAIDAGPVFGDTGELLAVVETLRDITAERTAQLTLSTLASCDGLTGLANRRRFDEYLTTEWLRGQREGEPLALLMIDIDHFKEFNDAAGHQKGDRCLIQIANAIASQTLRPGDQSARYGGDEFVVLMPNTDVAGALVVADRIMTATAALRLPHPSPIIPECVTLSIGLACEVPSPISDSAVLVAAADSALYRAKRDGRNRIVADHSEGTVHVQFKPLRETDQAWQRRAG